MFELEVFAPLSGQVWPIERVPDPVFAQKLVGDGLSVDPTDAVLLAGCDGEVIGLHAAGHAVTVRASAGIEVLMHVGIDTVTLKGEGFRPRVKKGDRVRTGTPLIEFDLDLLATHAPGSTRSWASAPPHRACRANNRATTPKNFPVAHWLGVSFQPASALS
jgi:phosphocarrier protein FPr